MTVQSQWFIIGLWGSLTLIHAENNHHMEMFHPLSWLHVHDIFKHLDLCMVEIGTKNTIIKTSHHYYYDILGWFGLVF